MDLEKMRRLTQNMENVNENQTTNISDYEIKQLYNAGVENKKFGHHKVAFDLFGRAAEHGNANAMFEIGVYYYRGEYVKKDVFKSFGWCKKAAEGGNINAMNWVGDFYENGEGVQQNFEEALKWYKRSADGGNVSAMLNLALMYDKGKGIPENKSSAVIWYEKAANAGNSTAMNNLGLLYKNGDGVPKNITLGMAWLNKAMNSGNSQATANLGYYYLYGLGVNKNEEKGWDLMEKAGKAGNVWAMEKYGDYWYEEKYNLHNAVLLYKMAAEHGSGSAAYKLGELCANYELPFASDLGLTNEKRHPFYWFDKAESLKCDFEKVRSEWRIGSGGKSDSCFITTAVCDSFGKADDCYELTAFRNFRDKWLALQEDGKNLIAEYYDVAPKIVEKINSLSNSAEIYKNIWTDYLSECLKSIEDGDNLNCKKIYVEMVNTLKEKFLR